MSSISNRRSAIELDLAPIQHRAKACAAALGVSPSAAQQYADQAEEIYDISIKRAEGGPKVRLYSPTDIFTMSRIRRDTRLWKPLHRAVKIAVYAQKGGVSKTTMAGNIIVMLQLAGHTTLGIDLDHQGNLSTNFGYDPDLTDQEAKDQDICPERVVHHHFGNLFEIVPFYEEAKGTCVPLAKMLKKPFGEHGPHLIASDSSLSTAEQAFAYAPNRDYLVREMLNEATDRETTNAPMHDYDFIVFDCPPQAAHNPLIRPTLLACDIIVTPVRMDAFSIKGLSQMFNELNMMVKCFKHRPKILLVPTFYDERLRRCRDAMEYLHSNFEEYLSGARIPTTEELPSNLSRPAPLALANPTAKVIQQNFTPLIKELIDVSYGLANSTSKAVTSNG